jgi:hypothetical protein
MDAVELKPTRRWPTEAMAARFERAAQAASFAELTKGLLVNDAFEPHIELPKSGVMGPAPQRLLLGDWLVRHGNAMFERMTDAIYRERFEPPGDELVPLADMVNTLPDPVTFRHRIMAAARERYAMLVTRQGEVRDEADTFQAQRDLAAARDTMKQYASTFSAVQKAIGGFQADQLERLPGSVEKLTVPDADGDITVALDMYNEHAIDTTELQAAVCAVVLDDVTLDQIVSVVEDADSECVQREWLSGILAQMLIAAQAQLVALGKFEPQVTKVREFAKEQARTGADGLAAVIVGTISTKRKSRGEAKFSRKDPKT